MSDREFFDEDRGVTIEYDRDETGLLARIPSQLPDREFPLQYALGSGLHAVTFLTVIPDQFGEPVGVEHRVSIFGDGTLQRTPGAASLSPAQEVEFLGKLILGDKLESCIGCHTTTSRWEGATVVDLRPNVQCERCHGPGSAHIAAVDAGVEDMGLRFVPGRTTALAEIRMCGECHRLPETLSDSELDRTSKKLPRYQPVGLLQSPCYLESDGALRCSTCHDPHEPSAARSTAEYEAICASCHQDHAVAHCSVSAENCVSCHMPPVEVHPGIAFHDHWIRVRDSDDPPSAAAGHP